MAKPTLLFVCNACGAQSRRWAGRCVECGAWNALEETTVSKTGVATIGPVARPIAIREIDVQPDLVIPTGLSEFDRVLGTGIVAGSVILLGGEPGIGKSTLSLQVASMVAQTGRFVLVVTGEESLNQVRLRAQRLGADAESVYVVAETDMQVILHHVETLQPRLVILDSIQVVSHPDVPSVSGTVNQVRYCAEELIRVLKKIGSAGIVIGHITKDGQLAGPKVLEHLVDVILYFEGDDTLPYRLLRSFKNRYASTQDMGIFEMSISGLVPIDNPSGLFVDETTLKNPGSMVAPIIDGNRVFLVEVQALVVETGYGMGRRTILGVEPHRGNLLIAAVEKIVGLKLSSKDIILNIVGGYKSAEPALDLAVVLAMFSSSQDVVASRRVGGVGEVGLTGEVRAVSQFERRLIELEKLGFEGCIVPRRNTTNREFGRLTLYPVDSIQDALRQLVAI